MRSPKIRLTVRRMMVLVLLVALPLSLAERSMRFRRLAETHEAWLRDIDPLGDLHMTKTGQPTYLGRLGEYVSVPLERWHADLYKKYDQAASHPWMILTPDPPEPE